jgi:hypothetical protein
LNDSDGKKKLHPSEKRFMQFIPSQLPVPIDDHGLVVRDGAEVLPAGTPHHLHYVFSVLPPVRHLRHNRSGVLLGDIPSKPLQRDLIKEYHGEINRLK